MDIGWFCESCYGVVASEGTFNILTGHDVYVRSHIALFQMSMM